MSDDALNPEALSRMRSYELPPEGFDPHTAPQEVLRRHGLPRRPDPDREPDLAWLWKRALARPPTFVKAELAIDPVMSRDPQAAAKPEFAGENIWAGQNSRGRHTAGPEARFGLHGASFLRVYGVARPVRI